MPPFQRRLILFSGAKVRRIPPLQTIIWTLFEGFCRFFDVNQKMSDFLFTFASRIKKKHKNG